MFHDDRGWCVRPNGSPEEVARLVTRRTWPPCAAFEVDGYLFLNDSLPEDGSTDFAVVKRPANPGEAFTQVASLTLGFWSYENALDLIRRVLAGEYDARPTNFAVEPRLETAAEHLLSGCSCCA
jgi:hypothetical protein